MVWILLYLILSIVMNNEKKDIQHSWRSQSSCPNKLTFLKKKMNEYYIKLYSENSTGVFPSKIKAEALREVEISKERDQDTAYT